MKSVDENKKNQEARNEVFRKSTKGLADMMKELKEEEEEKNKEEMLEEASHKLANYMRALEEK